MISEEIKDSTEDKASINIKDSNLSVIFKIKPIIFY